MKRINPRDQRTAVVSSEISLAIGHMLERADLTDAEALRAILDAAHDWTSRLAWAAVVAEREA